MGRFACLVLCAWLGFVLLGGCFETTTDNSPQLETNAPAVCSEPAQADEWRAEVLRRINQERAAHNVAALAHCQTLEDQADQYACEMIECGFTGHVNPCTGSTLRDRSIEFGYNGVYIGENLYEGQQPPDEVVRGWMASTRGHREAILDPTFTEMGVGVRSGGEHGLYWVLEFGRPQQFVAACTEPAEAADWQAEVLRLINAERAAVGVKELVAHPTLTEQAESFACELIDHCFFDHTNPQTGISLRARLEAAGYDGLSLGESLARGLDSPEEVVRGWMDDPADSDNLLDPRFVEVGVGVRANGGYEHFWVVQYAQPR